MDPSGFAASLPEVVDHLMSYPYGGNWSPSVGYYPYTSSGDAWEAGYSYKYGSGGGGGSWQPEYSFNISTTGRLGGFKSTGLIGGPKYIWQPGNFQIHFSSDITGWRWVANTVESGISLWDPIPPPPSLIDDFDGAFLGEASDIDKVILNVKPYYQAIEKGKHAA